VHTKIWLENVKERNQSNNLDVDGRITLEWVLKSMLGDCGLDSSVSG
jgi:hypothetical protein